MITHALPRSVKSASLIHLLILSFILLIPGILVPDLESISSLPSHFVMPHKPLENKAFQPPSTLLASPLQVDNIDRSLPVGQTEGSFSAANGAASYSIPIKLPVGTAGLMPSLGLTYSSMGGNGQLGMGWSLTGLSSISRTGKNLYHDGEVKDISFTRDDKFALDGNRLVTISGTYGYANSKYRTEIETFSRITAKGTSGNGPAWFNVEMKNGLIYEYGRAGHGRFKQEGSQTIMVWRVTKIRDRYGNYMTFKYSHANRESRLLEINYTGNSAQGLSPYNKIKFSYNTSRRDKNTVYAAGSKIQSRYRITRITVTTQGELFREYRLAYKNKHLYTVLDMVTEYGRNGKHFNPVKFSYGESVQGFQSIDTNIGNEPFGESRDLQAVDINGDGFQDILATHWYLKDGYRLHSYYEVFRNNKDGSFSRVATGALPAGGTGYVVLNKQTFSLNLRNTVSDYNGDGREDMLTAELQYQSNQFRFNKVKIYPGQTSGAFSSPVTYNTHPDYKLSSFSGGPHIYPGDYDGDGVSDFMYVSGGTSSATEGEVRIFISFPGKNEFNQFVGIDGISDLIVGREIIGSDQVIPMDFNGDGKLDLMTMAQDRSTRIYTLEKSTGANPYKLTKIYDADFPTVNHQIQMGDFNGDGKTDFLTREDDGDRGLAISTGKEFKESVFNFHTPVDYNPASKIDLDWLNVGDFNGDGKSDIVHGRKTSSTQGKFDVYYSRGDAFSRQAITANVALLTSVAAGPQPWILGDYNGDGRVDALNRISIAPPQNIFSFRQNNEYLLSKVTDSFGRETELSYEEMNQDGSLYTKGSSASYPLVDVQGPLLLLSEVKTPNGIGGTSSTFYKYHAALAHKGGRGLLGFSKLTTYNPTQNIKTITDYEVNTTYYRSVPSKVRTERNSNGAGISETTYDYRWRSSGAGRHWYNVSATESKDLIHNRTSQSTATYDGTGNMTRSSSTTTHGERKEVEITYVRKGSWIKNVPSLQTEDYYRGSDHFEKKMKWDYNSKGKVSREYDFFGQAGQVKNTKTYDGFGNLKKEVVAASGLSSRTTEYTYDSKGRYIVKLKNPLGHESFAQHHPVWGTKTAETSIQNTLTAHEYDDMGRLTNTAYPDGSSVSIQRSWDDGSDHGSGWTANANSLFTITEVSSSGPDVRTRYDILEREWRTETQHFDGSWLQQVTEYDSRGRIRKATGPFKLGNEPKMVTWMSYDANDRLTLEELFWNPSNPYDVLTTESIYENGQNGRHSITKISPDGKRHTSVTDASGRVLTATDDGGTLTYTYDALGQQTEVKLEGVVVAQMGYDEYGRQISLFDPNAGTTVYQYDYFGQLTHQTDGRGKISSFTFDKLGRTTKETTEEGETTYTYVTSGNGLGELKKVTHYSGVEEVHNYDTKGRLSSSVKKIDGETFYSSVSYDSQGRVDITSYPTSSPSFFSTRNHYNARGYLEKVTTLDGSKTIWHLKTVNELGQHTRFTLGNGQTSNHTYNNLGFPTRFKSGTIQDLRFTFNEEDGNLTQRYDARKNKRETFSYDDLDRLTRSQVDGQTAVSLTYADNGNISSKSDAHGPTGGFLYHFQKRNAVAGVSNPSSSMGNQTQDITYDTFQQPTRIEEWEWELDIMYGPSAHRAKSTLKQGGYLTETRKFVGNYEQQTYGSTTRGLHYISGGEGLNAIMIRENGQENFYYVYKDYLGSILTITDENKNKVGEQNFDAWGRYRHPDSWAYQGKSRPVWMYRGYTGHEHYGQLRLVNMNGRMYDPIMGRMLSPDNFVAAPYSSQGYNRFAYANNNPLKYTDPSGEIVWAPVIIGAVLGGLQGLTVGLAEGEVFGHVLAGAFLGGLSGLVGGSVTQWLGQTLTVSGAGTYAAAIGGALGGAISGGGFTALSGGDMVDGFWKGALSGFVGGGVGAYIGGGTGAFAGGVVAGGVSSGLNGGDIIDIARSSLMSGLLAWGGYEIQQEISFEKYKERVGTFEEGGLSKKQFRAISIASQRSFARGKEFGGWLLSNEDVEMWNPGEKAKIKPTPKPGNETGFFHTHPNWGKNWQESHSTADITVNNVYAKTDSYVIGRQNVYLQKYNVPSAILFQKGDVPFITYPTNVYLLGLNLLR